jgi:hypothetical protein
MIDLSKAERSRQRSVWVEGEEYLIHTGFHYWLSFGKKLDALEGEGFPVNELTQYFKVIENDGKVYGVPENRNAAYEELLKFYLNKQPLPNGAGKASGIKIIDWDIDSEGIYCAFLERYKINLITADLHWHDFLSLYNNLFWPLGKIIEARLYKELPEMKEKEYAKYLKNLYKENRDMWMLESLEPEKEPFKMR